MFNYSQRYMYKQYYNSYKLLFSPVKCYLSFAEPYAVCV